MKVSSCGAGGYGDIGHRDAGHKDAGHKNASPTGDGVVAACPCNGTDAGHRDARPTGRGGVGMTRLGGKCVRHWGDYGCPPFSPVNET